HPPALVPPNPDRLELPPRAQALRQSVNRLGIEVLAWLRLVPHDPADRDPVRAGLFAHPLEPGRPPHGGTRVDPGREPRGAGGPRALGDVLGTELSKLIELA